MEYSLQNPNVQALGDRQLKALWDYYDKNKDAVMNRLEFEQVSTECHFITYDTSYLWPSLRRIRLMRIFPPPTLTQVGR